MIALQRASAWQALEKAYHELSKMPLTTFLPEKSIHEMVDAIVDLVIVLRNDDLIVLRWYIEKEMSRRNMPIECRCPKP